MSNTTNRPPDWNDVTLDIDDWIASCLSLQPDRSLGIRSIGTSWDALGILLILSHVANLFWITEDITRKVAQKAYLSNYEGEWATVQVLLERNPQTPRQFYEIFLEFHSPEEYFGNLKRRAMRLLYSIKFYMRDPQGPVRRPQRARGYKDKGNLRPIHQYHGDPPTSDELRIDRRDKIGHPLISSTEERNSDVSIVPIISGGDQNDSG